MNTLPTILPTISSACKFFQILSIIFPFLCILSCCSKAPSRGLVWCCVAGLAIYEIIVFLLGTVLGNIGFLNPLYYRTLFCSISFVLLICALRNLPALFAYVKTLRYRPAWVDLLLLACVWNAIKLIDVSFVNDWSTGTASFDSLNYHIPRALVWSWQGSFAPTGTNIWQQLGHPYGGASTVLPITFLGCGWLGGSYLTLVLSVGAVLAVFTICRSYNFSARASLVSGLFLLSCPAVGWRLADSSTDIAATFPVIAAVALVRSKLSLHYSVFVFPLLVGLGTSIKQYVAFPAIPITLALFLPHTKEILTTRRPILAGIAGTLGAGFFIFLSFFPIFRVFGNLLGDALPSGLSNIGAGWQAAWASIKLTLVEWTFDPIRFLPPVARQGIFDGFDLAGWLDYLGFNGYNGITSAPDKERCRAGLLSLVLLPWLVSAFGSWGKRLAALSAFSIIFFFQFAPLAINSVGARFAIIPLAAFCTLFVARASVSPVATMLLLFLVSYQSLKYAPGVGYISGGRPHYNPYHEQNRDLYPITKDDTILLVGRPLSQDAKISGVLGQVRFRYFRCPPDNNWETHLIQAKRESKWILFGNLDQVFIPGPTFRTTLGPACPSITLVDFRDTLQRGGWILHKGFESLELWTHQ